MNDASPERAWGRDLVTSLIGLWIVAGIFTDGWAHVHIPELETFFTPWHASFYSGLVAFAIWLGVIALRSREPGDTPQQTLRRLPTGYRGAVVGVAIFAVGGAVDMLWHTLLGIEASIDALLSPPHLVLLTGVLLMTTTGWRSQRAVSPAATLPELVSLTSAVAITGFFLNYLSPFRWAAPIWPYGRHGGDDTVLMWIGGLLVTTVLVTVPLLWQIRDGRHRVGTLTAFVVAVGLGDSIAMSQYPEPRVLYAGVAGAALAALLAEFLLVRGASTWSGWRYGLPVAMGATAFGVWSGHLVGTALVEPIAWPATLWLGSLVLTAGAAAAIGSLTARPGAAAV